MDEKVMQAIVILGNIKNHTSWSYEDFKLKKNEAEIVKEALKYYINQVHGTDVPPDIPRAENTSFNGV